MYEGKRIVALIPARGGSKGIKLKNMAPLADKPLILYSIETALASEYIDDVVVTTDSLEIAKIANENGAEVPFIRPAELARDDSRTIDALLHAMRELEREGRTYDAMVLLQPTQPLRTVSDVDSAIELFFACGGQGVVSVSPVDTHPLLIRSINSNGRLVSLLSECSTCRRQDMPPFYQVNGCIYVNDCQSIDQDTSLNDNPIPYLMEQSRSIDIDEPIDLLIAQQLLELKSGD